MKRKHLSNLAKFSIAALLLSASSAVFAQSHYYWTRGFADTDVNTLFVYDSGSSSWLASDRLANVAANRYNEISETYIDKTTGIRKDGTGVISTWNNNVNLHIGAINSAYLGNTTTVSDTLVINQNVTINRLMWEVDAPNHATKIVATGGSVFTINSTQSPNYNGIWFRQVHTGSTYVLDANIVFTPGWASNASNDGVQFIGGLRDSMVIGSATEDRTITINAVGAGSNLSAAFINVETTGITNAADMPIIDIYATIKSDYNNQMSFNIGNSVTDHSKGHAILNFRHTGASNFKAGFAFRRGVTNFLMSKNGGTAGTIGVTASWWAVGQEAILNVFSQNDLSGFSGKQVNLFGGTNSYSGLFNLNGYNHTFGNIYFSDSTDGRSLKIDYGMSDHGMSAGQLVEVGITPDMINQKGSGAQTVIINNINGYVEPAAGKDRSHIMLYNFNVLEDKFLSKTNIEIDAEIYGNNKIRFYIDENHTAENYGMTDGDWYITKELVTIDSTNYYSYSYVTTIPEVSTCAAIFGVCALGFVAYRRRK